MNCINTICLYLKKYLTDEQFENIFYDYIEDFQNSLEEDIIAGGREGRCKSKTFVRPFWR